MTVEDPDARGGNYIKISHISMPKDLVCQEPFIVIEQHWDGRHDPKCDFRAEVGHGELTEKSLKTILRSLGVGVGNPAIETDRPTSPVTLPGWQFLNDNDKEK